MCGIAGVLSKDKTQTKSFIESALYQLKQRGPDDFGIYEDKSITLGMTRLEILDPSGGKQPMTYADRYVLVYNGQIYNHLALRKKIPEHFWQSHSDTETLLILLVNFGSAILNELEGMYCFALWDKKESNLLLARDSSGEKPMFFAIENNKLWFASTSDALRKSVVTNLDIDYNAVSAMLNTGFIPPSNSIYKNFSVLKAGHYLTYNGSDFKVNDFSNAITKNEFSENSTDFLDILTAAVQKQSIADVKVGLFLSGGLDSSLLAHIMHRQIGTYDCFTAKLHNNSSDLQAARKIAKKLRLRYNEIDVKDSDIDGLLTKQSAFFDEPFGDSAAVSLIAMSEAAKKQVGVCLSGDGADELFAGYGWKFRPFTEQSPISSKILPRVLNRSLAQIMTRASKQELAQYFSDSANKQLFNKNKSEIIKAYLLRNYTNQRYIQPNWLSLINHEQTLADEKYEPLEIILEFERLFYLIGDILVKTDRASMGCSLEARTPFLDPAVLNYSRSTNSKSKISWYESKIVVKKAFTRETKSEYPARVKQGLGGPVNYWLNIPTINRRLTALERTPFSNSLKTVFGTTRIKKAMNASPQFKWNYLNLLLWAETRDVLG